MKATKTISLLCAAALLAGVPTALDASAAQADRVASSGETSGTIKFDPGDWDVSAKRTCFYIWDDTGAQTMYATKNGWTESNPWGSKKTCGTETEDGLIESFEFTIPEGHDVYLIVFNSESGVQTYDCLLTEDAFGDTAKRTGTTSPSYDGAHQIEEIKFEKSGLTTPLMILPDGRIVGESVSKNNSKEKIAAEHVARNIGSSSERTLTPEGAAEIFEQLGVKADDVWAEYCKLDQNKYWNYNERAAKAMIRPTGYTPESGEVLIGFDWYIGYNYENNRADADFVDLENPGELSDICPADITENVIKERTCETSGVTEYTATAFREGEKYTSVKKVTTIRTGHKYRLTGWEWSEDYTQAWATFTCDTDPSHTKTIEARTSVYEEDPDTNSMTIEASCYAGSSYGGSRLEYYDPDYDKNCPFSDEENVYFASLADVDEWGYSYRYEFYETITVNADGQIVEKIDDPQIVAKEDDKKPEPETDTDAEIKPVPTPDTDSETKPEPTPDTDSETKPEPTPDTDSETKPEPDDTDKGIWGDMDGDGVITSGDALIILRASLLYSTLTPEQEALADVNSDDVVDALDAMYVLRASVGFVDFDMIGKPKK